VGVAGVGVQQTWDLTLLPEAVRATRDFKQSILVFVQQIDSGVSSVASAVSFLPATGTPTALVLTLTAAAPTDVLALDVWYLHTLEGLAAGSQAYFVAKPGAGSGAQESIVWRPGVPSNGAVVETWAEVEARIAATQGNIVVQVDSSLAPAIIPEETDTECFGRVQLVGYTLLLGAIMTVTIVDGGRLRNLFTVKSMALSGVCKQHDMLLQNIDGGVLICREGGQINMELGSTKSAIRMAGTFSEIAAFEEATFNNNAANPLLAMIAVEPGKVIIHAIISQAGSQAFSGADAYSPQLFSGDATTTLLEVLDSSAPQVTQTLFLGTVNAVPMSTARGTSYDDTLALPPLGVANVQAAIDALKNSVPTSGVYTAVSSGLVNTTATPQPAKWIRVGNVVTVAGSALVKASVPGPAIFQMTLPFASNFTLATQASGVAANTLDFDAGVVTSDNVTDLAQVLWSATTVALQYIQFSFSYEILP
jgi:hypothetical protein